MSDSGPVAISAAQSPQGAATPSDALAHRPLSLRRNFSWTFVGTAVYSACQWGMLVVLAKLGNPEMVGLFTLGLAVTAPVLMFTNLALRQVQATDARREYTFGDYLGLRLVMTLLALVVIAGIAIASGYRGEAAAVVLLLGLAKAFESISDIFYGLLQQRERMERIAISMMLKGALSLVILSAVVLWTGSIVLGVAGLAATWCLLLVLYDVRSGAWVLGGGSSDRVRGAFRPQWDIRTLARLAWVALPLGFVMMLISLNTNVPRYVIERQIGTYELGIFAATAYLMTASTTVVGALGQSASPKLSQFYARGDVRAYRTLLLKLVAVGGLLGLGDIGVAAVGGHYLLTLLYRPEYAVYTTVFVWLMVASAIQNVASFLGYGMTAARRFRPQLLVSAVVTSTTLLISVLFIPRYGLVGAAMALIGGASCQVFGNLAIITRAIRDASKVKHQRNVYSNVGVASNAAFDESC